MFTPTNSDMSSVGTTGSDNSSVRATISNNSSVGTTFPDNSSVGTTISNNSSVGTTFSDNSSSVDPSHSIYDGKPAIITKIAKTMAEITPEDGGSVIKIKLSSCYMQKNWNL